MSERKPLYTPECTPLIKNAKRLTGTRTKQLVRAAARGADDPPPKPGLGECCGSSCDPCVNDLWREEVECWRERWGFGIEKEGGNGKKDENGLGKREGEAEEKKEMKMKMPGSFEW